jgi:hypothetical protein
MESLHKKGAASGLMGLDDLYLLRPYAADLDQNGNAEEADNVELIPVKPGRELIEVSHQGAKCYRLEKTKCGKKSCRCARGELHGPYWYAYYRENGRMHCEYVGKTLSEQVSLENRAREACKNAKAERERAAKTVAEVRKTLEKLARSDGFPKLAEPP